MDGDASPASLLERVGWARTVGSVNPYLTLFARAGISRAAADKAASDHEIHELPSARGCTYKKLLYVGAFRLKPYDGLPLHVEADNVTTCGCPPGKPDCCDPMPRVVELIPTDGDPVAQYEEGYAKENGVIYDFHNFQSWIDPECTMGGSNGRHIDWLAVVVNGA